MVIKLVCNRPRKDEDEIMNGQISLEVRNKEINLKKIIAIWDATNIDELFILTIIWRAVTFKLSFSIHGISRTIFAINGPCLQSTSVTKWNVVVKISLGSNYILLCSWVWWCTMKVTFEPRIKLNHKKYCTTKKDPKHKWIATYALSTKV